MERLAYDGEMMKRFGVSLAIATMIWSAGTSVGRANVRTSSGIVYVTNEISDEDAIFAKRQQFLKDHVLLFLAAAALVAIVTLLFIMRLFRD